jgi:hypothetical protein
MRTTGRLAAMFLACVLVEIATAAPPGTFTSLTLQKQAPEVGWSPVPDAQTYDVVGGDLGLLRSSGSSFTATVLGCLAPRTAETSVNFANTPAPGEAFWILVRGDNAEGNGTYDSMGTGQLASRDAGINASSLSCGYQAVCGDAYCTNGESCTSCPADCGFCGCTFDSECQPASCCNPTSCITIWEPQSCGGGGCGDGCWICLSACVCDGGQCTALF